MQRWTGRRRYKSTSASQPQTAHPSEQQRDSTIGQDQQQHPAIVGCASMAAIALLLTVIAAWCPLTSKQGLQHGNSNVQQHFTHHLQATKAAVVPDPPSSCTLDVRRRVRWGAATAAYQVEGAWNQGGRTPSIWDTLAHQPGRIKEGATGDVACDQYHLFPQDFAMMQSMGVQHYRFSFSWSRLLPGGGRGTPINPKGLAHYHRFLDAMLAAGITPYATMFHWDLPQVLQDQYGGFLSRDFIADFVNYADVLFKNFGGKVQHWMTFNEPWVICLLGYGRGIFAPGHPYGEQGQFACGHHLLLAHGQTVKLYRQQYQGSQGGHIGIALNTEWAEPWSDSPADAAAAQQGLDDMFGWFADPLYFGDYPQSLKECKGPLLPRFTTDEAAMVKGSLDFQGINFYTAKYYKAGNATCQYTSSNTNSAGHVIGPQAESEWLSVVPWSLLSILRYAHQRYDKPLFYITENGVSAPREAYVPVQQAVHDTFRVDYYRGYLQYLCDAIAEGIQVQAYFAWSIMDNFEWLEGYTQRFGLVHVAFGTPQLTRTIKDSGHYLAKHFFRMGASVQQHSQPQ